MRSIQHKADIKDMKTKKKPMKLAVLKRELKLKIGQRYKMVAVNRDTHQKKFELPVRTLAKVNAVSFGFDGNPPHGEISSMYWPKAKDLSGTVEEFTINSDGFNCFYTYTLIK